MKNPEENNFVGLSIELVLTPSHQREFLQAVLKIIKEGRLEDGNRSFHLQRDMEKDYRYELNSEWHNKQAIESYIRSQNFGTLLGALNVLTTNFDVKLHHMSFQEGNALIKEIRNQ